MSRYIFSRKHVNDKHRVTRPIREMDKQCQDLPKRALEINTYLYMPQGDQSIHLKRSPSSSSSSRNWQRNNTIHNNNIYLYLTITAQIIQSSSSPSDTTKQDFMTRSTETKAYWRRCNEVKSASLLYDSLLFASELHARIMSCTSYCCQIPLVNQLFRSLKTTQLATSEVATKVCICWHDCCLE